MKTTGATPRSGNRQPRPDPFLFYYESTGWILCLLSGLMLAATLPPWNMPWLGYIALVPLLAALRYSESVQERPFAAGWWTGFVYYAGTLWWIGLVTSPGTMLLMAYIALYPASWAFMVRHCVLLGPASDNVFRTVFNAFCLACSWVALEWFRGWFLTGFGWNNLGLAARGNTYIAQLAAFGGVNLLAFIIVFCNGLMAQAIERLRAELAGEVRGRFFYEVSLVFIVIGAAYWVGREHFYSQDKYIPRTLRFACLQGNIPRDDEEQPAAQKDVPARTVTAEEAVTMSVGDIVRRYMDMTRQADNSLPAPEVILWPECVSDTDMTASAPWLASRTKAWLMIGTMLSRPLLYNSAMWVEPRTGEYELYYKNNLVIFGEYVPLGNMLPMLRSLVPYGTEFTPGKEPVVFVLPRKNAGNVADDPTAGDIRLSPLICFEDTLPEYVRQAAKLNPDVLVNITNDSWFGTSPGAEVHLINSMFRTIENDMPMLRACNTGVTAYLDNRGVVKQVLADKDGKRVAIQGILQGTLESLPPRQTLYRVYGEWIVLISGVVAVMLMFSTRLHPYRRA